MRGSSRAQERKLFLVQKVPLAPAQDLIEPGDAAFDGRRVEHPVVAPRADADGYVNVHTLPQLPPGARTRAGSPGEHDDVTSHT